MEIAKLLIENSIKKQEELVNIHLGDSSIDAILYCILILNDMLNELDQSYEGEDGKLHRKNW